MNEEIKLFSQEFEAKKESDYFKRDVIKGAYLIGAFSKAIIDSSYNINYRVIGTIVGGLKHCRLNSILVWHLCPSV